ncbi:TcdA/TcdB pore-forming domain-containing protein [Photorhabdus aegyptia]|uniref:TcdA/TcdB pore forming protein n=1 Tax=Photorhabdus aegyptia TaxID=2805098 RepID=A0A022PR81_9GAMM|nr:TcdA/TcdB pore-forming domain-containing protein [Photorhabdus aegyptia]EYU16865.1 TcdA/TcdB pore forming protein [Photorhabdus aegyptia]
MPSNSYQSLLASAQATFKEMKSKPKIQMLIQEIKKGFRENGRKWSPQLLQQQKTLEQTLEGNAYRRYSNDRPVGISSLDKSEQQAFVGYIKALATRATTVDILVQGNEKTALASQTDDALDNAEAFRMLPKDFAQRYSARGKLGARLTINVSKVHFNVLARALTQLFNDDNRGWLEQAKIMGPKNLGSRTDQAVIYLSRAGIEHAQTISKKLNELLPATAFVEHTPTGMYRVGKGISYSETAAGGSSSHGQSRAQLIAAAGTQSLLTDIPIEKALAHTLQTRGYDVHNPALLSQALRDSELKGKLVPMNGDSEPRRGSADIHQFAADPVLFAKSNIINAETLIRSGNLPAEGNVQLVKIGSGLYELDYTDRSANNDVATEGANSIPAYFLGYDSANQANASPAYVDIPKHAIAGSFLFTGTLSGGSVVVTNLDANTYRVYHDGRINSSLLYDNVVMAVDYKDYQAAATTENLAVAYMQYVNDEWQLALQRQEYRQDGQMLRLKLRDNEEPLSIQVADSQVIERNQTQFVTYREQIHQRLKKVAAQFGVSVEGITDGVYTEGEFSPDHPAIAAWSKLRAEVYDKMNADTKQLADKRDKLYEERRTSSRHDLIDQQIKQINITLEYYKAQYDTILREAGFVEQSWLWQQIKSKDGMAAVVRIDNTPVQNSGPEHTSSVGERYAIAETYQHRVHGTAFTNGQRHFRDINIPGLYDRMSALEMKSLFLKGQLTPEQQGALSVHITETSQAEYIDKVLKWTAVYSEDFHRIGSSFDRLAPQDFYLSLVGDKSGGRCYPLVRAMAVALANSGEAGINNLVEKLFLAAADPHASSSTLLKNSLIKLHSNNIEAVQASTAKGQFKLSEVVSLLKGATKTSMFALNTPNHSMMVGSTVGPEGHRYYFYDPNVGIFAFNDAVSFFRAMKNHLVGRKLAAHYGSPGGELTPIFNLVEIDTGKMAEVPVGNDLNVADLTRPDELTTVIEQRRQVEQAVNAQVRIAKDARLHTALATLDAEQWGARFAEASTQLAQENNLDQRWMPVISNTEDQGEGRYRVQFINRDQPEETRWVSSGDATFTEFRRFVDEHMLTLSQHFTFEHGQIRPKNSVGEAAPVDGLNAGFAIQTLIQWFADKNRNDAARGIASPDLATALKVHSYLNFVQMAHGSVQDIAKVTALVRTALRGEVMAAETSLKDFTSILGHTVNEGAGVLFGGAMVGLDAYELAHAENDVQKAVFGTQLAFDSASFVTGTAGVGAGLMGASTAGAVLGGAGVILGGLAVGFTALAQAFGAVAEDAKAVGRYFNTLDDAYKGNGYRYDNEKKVLVPLPGAVIKTLDLRKNQIDFDSQYIYRTHSGSTGSGRINYFFWIGDFPKMVHDRSQAIEVRSGIGYKDASRCIEPQVMRNKKNRELVKINGNSRV